MIGIKSGAILIANPFKKLSLHTKIVFLILKSLGSQMAVRPGSKLDKMLNGSKKQPKAAADEMTQYLDSGMFNSIQIYIVLTD